MNEYKIGMVGLETLCSKPVTITGIEEISGEIIYTGTCSECQDDECHDFKASEFIPFEQIETHIEKLQSRVKELEELLAKEEHARSQANFAVVLLQERLKVDDGSKKE